MSTTKEAIQAISTGQLVDCTKEEYPEIRKAIQDYAGKQIDNGQDIYAQIALMEIKRLDDKLDFHIV
ncbi:MAG: hypothetical protein KKD18_02805 [Nanoarchaeota archaeon]|nr:hypothetical protein [Nanoarchaeota archaeon]